MPILAAETLLRENKKKQWKMLPLVGIEPGSLITSDSKSNTLLSGLSWHLLVRLRLTDPYIVLLFWLSLNPLSSSESKNQVVHEQKFKDFLSSTCQVSQKKKMAVLGIRGCERPGFYSTGGNIFHWISFVFSSKVCCQYWHYCHSCAFWKNSCFGLRFNTWTLKSIPCN